ncbi:MAG: flagellar hook-associated protein FlgK [Euryhalocaulis sp.]|uniref:flagellar hook-associated protein FlgK n=1 Tax=Euryhalocaulis sp. TaxID=2744307 RepID=UPI0017B67D86|nr:flagellar hook-associated protein FlgK [Euryhalocaulis sp.]MBA4800669.1 flagellar hook-associated protein FlgK [Euryhalocaulis sp.]
MSINGVLGNALTGLLTSQTAMRNTSNNIANVNTPGYARVDTQFSARSYAGIGAGVEIGTIRRVVSEFLDGSALRTTSGASEAETRADLLDRVQAQFGSPDDSGSIFARLQSTFTKIGAAALDPASIAGRQSAISQAEQLFDEFSRLSAEIRTVRAETDARIGDSIGKVNSLLTEIHDINAQISRLHASGGDVTGLENRQSQLIDELSKYVDVRTQAGSSGGVIVRTGDGVELVGQTLKTFEYNASGQGGLNAAYSAITLRSENGTAINIEPHIQSGELRGLLDVRDHELPELAAELSELAAGSADALNEAHNNATAVPAPASLTGRNTGLMAGDALNFSGATTVAITNADGTLARRVDIDFDAGTLSVDGGGATPIGGGTVGDLVTALNTALGGSGSASFTNGSLQISAAGGGGVSMLQDEANPSDRGGRGFSHFFGLNDMIVSERPAFFETGLSDADAHGFTPGETLTFRVTGANGTVRDIDVTVGGTSFADLRNAINDATSGIGNYGSIQFDADGQLSISESGGNSIQLVGDTTSRGGTGLSFSQMFGLSREAAAGRAEAFSVADRIANNPEQLSLAQLDLASGAVGDTVLFAGDNRGGLALQSMLTSSRAFDAAGGLNSAQTSLEQFASRVAGDIGLRAARADSDRASALALAEQAEAKRAEISGVNMDEELANMTIYQQSYNASARLIQAAKEMTDTLLNMV